MPNGNKCHMDIVDRRVIGDGLRDGLSAREIARRVGCAPSTIVREVRNNRIVRVPRKKSYDNRRLCEGYDDCQRGGDVCAVCASKLTTCKKCRARVCTDACPDYVMRMCPKTSSWPYVCPSECTRRRVCNFPKCSYDARAAQDAHDERLVETRRGIDLDEAQLAHLMGIVDPLVRKGQSFAAIWAEHADELPVCERTMYNYVERGDVPLAAIELPRKVRMKARKRKEKAPAGRGRIDRTGRTYDDFLALPEGDRDRVVMGDSVEGLEANRRRLLSLHWKRLVFQMYFPQPGGESDCVVAELDRIEKVLGGPGAFEAVLGILLVDRGREFDDWEGMETSCLIEGARRCRVFYCDAMNSNQKSQCERNHEELRRILPKGRSNFDALGCRDAALACSHVNSYPRPALGGARPYDLARVVLPDDLLDAYGVVRIEPDEVTLSPRLLPHVVKR